MSKKCQSQIQIYAVRTGLLRRAVERKACFLADMKSRRCHKDRAKTSSNHRKEHTASLTFTSITLKHTERSTWCFKRSDRNIAEVLASSDFFNSPCTCKAVAEIPMTNVTHSFKAHSVLHMWLLNPVFRTVCSVYWCLLGSKMWTLITGIHQMSWWGRVSILTAKRTHITHISFHIYSLGSCILWHYKCHGLKWY